MTIQQFFKEHRKVALAFSGGADSAYLLYEACRAGADIRPYYVKSAFQPDFEYRDAVQLCEQMQTELSVIRLDILSDQQIADNPADRCYYCKERIFKAIREQSAADGYELLVDGTNASDHAGDRPGMRALRELSVLSPLQLCGLTKQEIRSRSKDAGLFTWNKPAYACLATRIPTGRRITEPDLYRVERAEDELKNLGYKDFRVRIYEDAARLQLVSDQMQQAAAQADEIRDKLKPYFDTVFLDLQRRIPSE